MDERPTYENPVSFREPGESKWNPLRTSPDFAEICRPDAGPDGTCNRLEARHHADRVASNSACWARTRLTPSSGGRARDAIPRATDPDSGRTADRPAWHRAEPSRLSSPAGYARARGLWAACCRSRWRRDG